MKFRDRNVWLQHRMPPRQYTNHHYWGFAWRWMGERQPAYQGYRDRAERVYVMRHNKIDRRPHNSGGDRA